MRPWKAKHIETAVAYTFLLPNFIGFLVFTSLPVLASLFLSFMDAQLVPWPQVLSAKFVGFGNFVKLLGFHCQNGVWAPNDPNFWQFFSNTVFLMLAIPIQIFSSLFLAIVMNQKLRGITVFRTIYFLPTISNGVAICLLWLWIYNPNFGLLNSIIAKIGDIFHIQIQGPLWLSSPALVKPSLMLMGLWVAVGGYNTILYLAALQNIPRDFYEAAEIDGANAWQKFWSVTWPMISPTTFFISIMGVIWGFQGGFEQIYIMARDNRAAITLEYYIYNNLYAWHHVGYAASVAWFLFILIFIITVINWRFGGKLVNY